MKLTELEMQSAVWLKLRAHMESKLSELRSTNDGNLPHDETSRLRGRIAQLKELLTLGKPESNEAGIDG